MIDKSKLFQKMYETHKRNIETINDILQDNTKTSKIAKHLIETIRSPYSIFRSGYNIYDSSNFASLLNSIKYSLEEDGDITFVMINKEPMIYFIDRYSTQEDYFLSNFQKDSIELGDKYEVEFIDSIDEWIELSENYIV